MDPSDNNSTTSSHSAADRQQPDQPVVGTIGNATVWYQDLDSPDEDDEDPDYHDAPNEDEDDDDDEFHDAELGDIEFEVVIGGEEEDDDDDDDEDDEEVDDAAATNIIGMLRANHRAGILSRAQLRALLRSGDLGGGDLNSLLFDVEDEDGEFLGHWGRRLPRQRKDPNRFPKVPSDEGAKLMRSGAFGANPSDRRAKKQIARMRLDRELGLGGTYERRQNNDLITQDMVPGTSVEHIVHYDDAVYSGQFSDDGNFFYSCSQDFNVRMYDTSNPYNWKHYKTVSYPWGHWTLTDASLSPDNKWLAYTSIQSMVSIAPTDPTDQGDPYTLDLSDGQNRPNRWGWRNGGSFGIWSIRFSGDGRELVAGTNSESIVVYDIESRRVLHHIEGHDDDVNAVCFADKSSPHILYSGSDDATIKVWDTRSMGDKREAGAFVGHMEGLTYIDSKGDGRYILSNGKDQSMKLWDLRMVMSTDRFRDTNPTRHTRRSGFDYRHGLYDNEDFDVHPNDNSLVTFRGHKVLRTLIRCHFSPSTSTNSRYVYSGSADGKVYVWNMDATLANVIDVKKATMATRIFDRRTRLYFDEPGGWGTCVRDASWHPNAPVVVASAWNGYNMARGTCSMHSFNDTTDDEGDPEMGRSVYENLEADPEVYSRSAYGH